MSLKKHKEEWEELGELDPLWAILSSHEKKFGKWDLDEFFRTGTDEIFGEMASAKELGYPKEHKSALDFGCGVGRLTRALAKHFEEVLGVDISENMLKKGRELNKEIENCTFLLSTDERLGEFQDNSTDLIYTKIVLQHVPSTELIRSYIKEFVRILKDDGLLIFQLPCHIPLQYRFQPRRKLYTLLRTFGIKKELLYKHLGLIPIRMNFIPEVEVLSLLESIGAKILKVSHDETGDVTKSNTYYVTK
ncbi:MAG: class I SAM-dependent methyltransferase [Proteobacteria bacterium]|nr:class I SAM-dependent methyltransferase [Pseudomonadota bacterium]